MSKDRILYLDILRALSIMAVIFLHACSRFIGKLNMSEDGWYLAMIGDSIARWSVPIFFMISGALLLADNREIKIYSFLRNRCRYILVPFIMWSMIYNLLKYKNDIFYLQTMPIGMVFFNIIYEPAAGHLWFVYTILSFYIVAPLLKSYVTSATHENLLYFIGLSFIVSILLPINGLFLRTPFAEASSFLFNYLFYFIWGYYLYNIKSQYNKQFYALACLGVFTTIIGTYFVTKNNGGYYLPSNYFFKHNSLNVMLMASGVFLIVKNFKWDNFFNRRNYKEQLLRLLSRLSFLSYGVYLIHAYILDVIFFKFPVVINPFKILPFAGIILSFTCCLSISYFICHVISKLKVLNFLLVGSKS